LHEKLVFVVDDNKPVANLIVSFLKEHGYDAIAFYDLAEALAASASLHPDLLLSDFRMKTMDGLTLAMRLTERYPACKVLMMTGLADEAIKHPAFKKFEWLHKPVSLSVLIDKVVRVLGS